ncbi:hypothetical protein D3C75_1334960 [compost metagenome]
MVVNDDMRRISLHLQLAVQIVQPHAQERQYSPKRLLQRFTANGCMAHKAKAATSQGMAVDGEELIVEHVRQRHP